MQPLTSKYKLVLSTEKSGRKHGGNTTGTYLPCKCGAWKLTYMKKWRTIKQTTCQLQHVFL